MSIRSLPIFEKSLLGVFTLASGAVTYFGEPGAILPIAAFLTAVAAANNATRDQPLFLRGGPKA